MTFFEFSLSVISACPSVRYPLGGGACINCVLSPYTARNTEVKLSSKFYTLHMRPAKTTRNLNMRGGRIRKWIMATMRAMPLDIDNGLPCSVRQRIISVAEFGIDRHFHARITANMGAYKNDGKGSNCTGQFVLNAGQFRPEFHVINVSDHSNRYRLDMEARAVPTR